MIFSKIFIKLFNTLFYLQKRYDGRKLEIQFNENIKIINRKRKTHTFWVQI